jgi:hypothetical protein
MFFERLFVGLLLAATLFLLFLVTVRQGYFASPGKRSAMVAAISILALLVWLGPFLAS